MRNQPYGARAFFFLFLIVGLGGCRLADIRPEGLKGEIAQADVERGKKLLNDTMTRAGGIGALRAHRTVEVTLRDEWPGFFFRSLFMPWPGNKQLIKFQFLLDTSTSRLEFLEDPGKGEVWGVQNWMTYTQKPGEEIVFKKHKNAKFYLAAFQFFFEFPFRIPYASFIAYAGEESIGGQNYDRVFVSWNTAAPQKKIDQFIVWINKRTGLIDYIRYTVRDFARFAKGTMQFGDYRDVQGIMVPFKQTVVTNSEPDGDNVLHELIFEEVKFGVDIPEEIFYPNPAMTSSKHE